MNKIFLDELPKKEGIGALKGKQVVDWKASIGYTVKFSYDDINGEVEIVDYDKKYLYIKYLDNEIFKISTGGFQECKLGKLLGKHTKDFKIEVGKRFIDYNNNGTIKRDITIIDRKYIKDKNGKQLKYYKYKCNKCGFECGKHYSTKDNQLKKEYWIYESSLLKGIGCACCHSIIVVEGINDIPTTVPWMVKYFQGGYKEAKKYTRYSHQKFYPVCPDCNSVKKTCMEIGAVYLIHSIGCICSDGLSYPEKFMFHVLEQLEIDFITQLTKTTFEWIGKYKYDFYFTINNCNLS